MDITKIKNDGLGKPIAYYKTFADITGCVNSGLLLSQCLYWTPRSSLKDGWFWKSMSAWEEELGLTRYQLQSARKKLVKKGFMEESRKGKRPGADMHYKLNVDVIYAAIIEQKTEEN
ncbi:MAG: hypothetical protein QM484_11395 [Woeseiaceae bacterium]